MNIVASVHRPSTLISNSLSVTSNWRDELMYNAEFLSEVEQKISEIEAQLKTAKVPLFFDGFSSKKNMKRNNKEHKDIKTVSPKVAALLIVKSAVSITGSDIIGKYKSNPNHKQLVKNLTLFLKMPANSKFTIDQMIKDLQINLSLSHANVNITTLCIGITM
ncbi:hypothetical protein FF38_03817 [Lucilia cuprina]|uniref:Uncharacterized protein n=1 Tax=Lucilia cuprina TaxID=7375 RepID=A0A0L0BSD3_LUCCU|nr:hypothetical protein FF38_03817 [Lucilia cuprina]